MADIDWSGYLEDSEMAARDLGRSLHQGELALFLGTGISLGYAPGWHALARAMSREAGVDSAGINRKKVAGDHLAHVFTNIHRKVGNSFESLVKKWLYCRWTARSGNWASDTLVALGSLMSGSTRGRVDMVLTLNFDSILEMYLRLYGFVAQSITTYPEILRRADVHIFHSHGYLPYDVADGNESSILLDNQTYLEAIGDPGDPRRRVMEYVFAQKTVLAIGLSGDDIYSRSVLAALATKQPSRAIMGYWIVGPDTSADKVADLRDSKLAAVRLSSYRQLPEFLLNVSRYAARFAGIGP